MLGRFGPPVLEWHMRWRLGPVLFDEPGQRNASAMSVATSHRIPERWCAAIGALDDGQVSIRQIRSQPLSSDRFTLTDEMSKDPIDGFFVGEAPDLMTACRLHGGCGFRVHRVRPIDNGGKRGCAINLARGGGASTHPPATRPVCPGGGVNPRQMR